MEGRCRARGLTPARDPSSIRVTEAPPEGTASTEVDPVETIKRDAEALAVIAACLAFVGSAGAVLSLAFRAIASVIGA